MRHPRFTGMALSVLVLMVAPIAACGGTGTTYTPPPTPTPPCMQTQQTPVTFHGGGGFDATSIPVASIHPAGEMDGGYSIVPIGVQVTLSQPSQFAGQIQGAHVARRVGLAASVGHLSGEVSSTLCSGTVPVSCQQNSVLGGGFNIVPTTGVSVVASYPSSTTSWTVTVLDRTGTPQTVTAYADCYTPITKNNIPPPDLGIMISHTDPMNITQGHTEPVVAMCSPGLALDGGFKLSLPPTTSDSAANVVASYPTMGPAPTPIPTGGATSVYNQWTVQAYAPEKSKDVTEVAYVVCESKSTYAVDVQSSPLASSGNITLSATIPSSMCPGADYRITGGGFSSTFDKGTSPSSISYDIDNSSGSRADTISGSTVQMITGWQVEAHTTASGVKGMAYAVCV